MIEIINEFRLSSCCNRECSSGFREHVGYLRMFTDNESNPTSSVNPANITFFFSNLKLIEKI